MPLYPEYVRKRVFARRFAEFGRKVFGDEVGVSCRPSAMVDMLKRFPVKLGIIKFVNGTIPYGNGAIASLYSQAINHRVIERWWSVVFSNLQMLNVIPEEFVFIFVCSFATKRDDFCLMQLISEILQSLNIPESLFSFISLFLFFVKS